MIYHALRLIEDIGGVEVFLVK